MARLFLIAALLAIAAATPALACWADDPALALSLGALPGLTNLTTCAEMQPWCLHPMLGYFVRQACPSTCEVSCYFSGLSPPKPPNCDGWWWPRFLVLPRVLR